MKIKCHGSRGSIPVSGSEYLKYGGDTPCLEITAASGETVIIDAGSGIRKLGTRLLKEKIHDMHLIFTHAHWDHIMGFPFFKPIYFSKTHISMYGCPFAQNSVRKMISKSMEPPNFPVRFDDVLAKIEFHETCINSFDIGSLHVEPILLSHPNQGIGYKFIENSRTFVFLTDNELTFQHPGGLVRSDYLEFARGADFLIHDSEYTPEDYKTKKMWGHSVYTDALDLAIEAAVPLFGLYHHNQERSDSEIDTILDDCKHIIKEREIQMKCVAVSCDYEIEL